MKLKVSLKAVGNTDHGQDPNRPPYGVRNKVNTVASFKEASELCQTWIAANDLGGGNWAGGQITQDGKEVGRVSYNGRVWDMDGKEIQM